MHLTKITFPQLRLQRRDAHKLRGYFANTFGQESDLFHNHDAAGKAIYRYPRIQYKVVRGTPTLIGIDAGAELLVARFLSMKEIDLEGLKLPLDQKNLQSKEYRVGVGLGLEEYQFVNPWMALNAENHQAYLQMSKEEQKVKLQKILTNNMISFFKAVKHQEKERIMVRLKLTETIPTKFKNQNMLAFKGSFTTNVQLPDGIGLGKSVAKGFGALERID